MMKQQNKKNKMKENSIQDDLDILHDIEEDDFNPLNLKPGAG